MLLSTYFLGLISALSLVQAMRIDIQPRAKALKQATRSEIITRATRVRDVQRRQVSVQPYPKCSDYVSTGDVPYARWDGLDYNSLAGAIYTGGVETREECIKLCEVDSSCIVSTYNKYSYGCFKVTLVGTFFLAPFDATIKGVTCESSTALIEQYREASCCTEYRAATPEDVYADRR